MADNYVVKQETDFWGNDKTVIRRETTAADVGAAVGTVIGVVVAANQRAAYSEFKRSAEQIDQVLSNGDYSSAYDQATTLSKSSDRDYRSVGLIRKARAARYLTKYDEALGDLDTALQLLADSGFTNAKDIVATAHFERACVFLAKGDSPNAIREFTKVIQSDPTRCSALNGRGTALRKIGNYEQSIVDLSQATQFEPGESDHFLERGLTYIELKDYEKALIDFAQAAALTPASSAGYRNRGMVFALRGEHEKAIAEYDRALQVNSAYAANFLARAKSYRTIGKEYEASIDESSAAQIEKQEKQVEKEKKTHLAYLDAAEAMFSEGFTKAYSMSDRYASVNLFKAIGYPIMVLIPFFMGLLAGYENSFRDNSLLVLCAIPSWAIAISVFLWQLLQPGNHRWAYEKYATKIAGSESSMPSFGRFYQLYLEARGKSEMGSFADKARPLIAEVVDQDDRRNQLANTSSS